MLMFAIISLFIYLPTKGDEESKDNTTLQFDLKVKCIRNKNAPKNATDPDELFINSKGMLHAVVGRMQHIRSVSWAIPFYFNMHASLYCSLWICVIFQGAQDVQSEGRSLQFTVTLTPLLPPLQCMVFIALAVKSWFKLLGYAVSTLCVG